MSKKTIEVKSVKRENNSKSQPEALAERERERKNNCLEIDLRKSVENG